MMLSFRPRCGLIHKEQSDQDLHSVIPIDIGILLILKSFFVVTKHPN